jgi:hypothetical protein
MSQTTTTVRVPEVRLHLRGPWRSRSAAIQILRTGMFFTGDPYCLPTACAARSCNHKVQRPLISSYKPVGELLSTFSSDQPRQTSPCPMCCTSLVMNLSTESLFACSQFCSRCLSSAYRHLPSLVWPGLQGLDWRMSWQHCELLRGFVCTQTRAGLDIAMFSCCDGAAEVPPTGCLGYLQTMTCLLLIH